MVWLQAIQATASSDCMPAELSTEHRQSWLPHILHQSAHFGMADCASACPAVKDKLTNLANFGEESPSSLRTWRCWHKTHGSQGGFLARTWEYAQTTEEHLTDALLSSRPFVIPVVSTGLTMGIRRKSSLKELLPSPSLVYKVNLCIKNSSKPIKIVSHSL